MRNITLSIITIAYNNLAGLSRTAMSVLSQTSTDFEWIVVDGASTDGTLEFLSKIERQWRGEKERLHIISEPDSGIYNAMNKGIRMAHGEYCLFLNGGDYLCSDTIVKEVLTEGLKGDICAGYVVEEVTERRIAFPFEQVTPWMLMQQNIPHQAAFIKRSLLFDFGLYVEDLRILSDFEMMLRATIAGKQFDFLDKQIAVVEPGGISNTQIEKMRQEQDIILRRVLPFYAYIDYTHIRNELTKAMEAQKWFEKSKCIYRYYCWLKHIHRHKA